MFYKSATTYIQLIFKTTSMFPPYRENHDMPPIQFLHKNMILMMCLTVGHAYYLNTISCYLLWKKLQG